MSAEISTELANLISMINRYEPRAHGALHQSLGCYLAQVDPATMAYRKERDLHFTKDGVVRAGATDSITGPPCPVCGEDLRWMPSDERGVRVLSSECVLCLEPTSVTA